LTKFSIYLGIILSFVACSLIWSRFAYDKIPYRAGTSLGFILSLLCAWSAYSDFFYRKIYNLAVYSAFVAIIVELVWANALGGNAKFVGSVGFESAIVGAICCFCIPFAPYLAKQGGAGDVKLAAVVGCALGTSEGILTVAVAYVVAFIWAILDLVVRKIASLSRSVGDEQIATSTLKRSIPMAPSFFIAVVATTTGLCQRALDVPLIEF